MSRIYVCMCVYEWGADLDEICHVCSFPLSFFPSKKKKKKKENKSLRCSSWERAVLGDPERVSSDGTGNVQVPDVLLLPMSFDDKSTFGLPIATTRNGCVITKRQWFSGKIHRCHRWAPRSIRGWRIVFAVFFFCSPDNDVFVFKSIVVHFPSRYPSLSAERTLTGSGLTSRYLEPFYSGMVWAPQVIPQHGMETHHISHTHHP